MRGTVPSLVKRTLENNSFEVCGVKVVLFRNNLCSTHAQHDAASQHPVLVLLEDCVKTFHIVWC